MKMRNALGSWRLGVHGGLYIKAKSSWFTDHITYSILRVLENLRLLRLLHITCTIHIENSKYLVSQCIGAQVVHDAKS